MIAKLQATRCRPQAKNLKLAAWSLKLEKSVQREAGRRFGQE